MSSILGIVATCALLLAGVVSVPTGDAGFSARQESWSNLTVDLEYAIYQGVKSETTGLNVWKG